MLETFVKRLHSHRLHTLGDQIADRIIHHGGDDAGVHPETVGEIGRNIEFAAADVNLAGRRFAKRNDARIQAVHQRTEGNQDPMPLREGYSDHCSLLLLSAVRAESPNPMLTTLHRIGRRGGVSAVPCPVGVEEFAPRPVDALVLMRAEIIALRLKQIGRQPRIPESVVVAQRRRHGRDPDSVQDRRRYNAPPGFLRSLDPFSEKWIQQQVRQAGIRIKCIFDLREKCRADDAAAAPEQRDPAVVQIPLIFLRRLMQENKALGIGNDLRGIERLLEVAQKSLLFPLELVAPEDAALATLRPVPPSWPTDIGQKRLR